MFVIKNNGFISVYIVLCQRRALRGFFALIHRSIVPYFIESESVIEMILTDHSTYFMNKITGKILVLSFFLLCFVLSILSYGFIDLNLTLTTESVLSGWFKLLSHLICQNRLITAGIYTGVLFLLFILFGLIWKHSRDIFPSAQSIVLWCIPLVLTLVISYPMVSYDLFNYMATAKVAYTYRENPYVVMPIEIPNDSNLSFTRAANKFALYGPPWILLTWIPHTLGMGNVWLTIVAFKLMNAIWYVGFCYLIWRVTKNMKNVIFFALNPLVLIEILVSGHNDIAMMGLSCAGLLLWQKKEWISRFFGLFIFILSVFIKGATIVLVPLLFFRKMTQSRLMLVASCLLFFVFLIIAPLREELYPWYAVWFLSTAAFLPYSKYAWFWQFCIALSFGLELRYIPYMAMGYYEGPGPILRTVLTFIPPFIWFVWISWKEKLVHKVIKFIKL